MSTAYPLARSVKAGILNALGTRVGAVVNHLLDRSGERVRQMLVSGALAGDITVTGIAASDRLISVLCYIAGAGLSDLTSEFRISGASTINNAGGTNTIAGVLIVTYGDRT